MGRAENALQRACLEYLKIRGVMAWRNNTGLLRDRNGKPVRFGVVGSGDIFAVVGGRFLSVECKVKGGKVSDHQKRWAEEVNSAGGMAIVAETVDDVHDALEDMRGDA